MRPNPDFSFGDPLEAGCNIVYTDMYAPRERFAEQAQDAGYTHWFYYPEGDAPTQPEGMSPVNPAVLAF